MSTMQIAYGAGDPGRREFDGIVAYNYQPWIADSIAMTRGRAVGRDLLNGMVAHEHLKLPVIEAQLGRLLVAHMGYGTAESRPQN